MSDSDSSDHYEPVDDVNDSGDENAATKSPLKTDESGKNQINTDPPEDESDQGEEDEENDHPEQDEEILEDVLEDEEILDDGDNMADGTEPSTPTDQPTRAPVDRLTQLPLSRIKNLLKNFDPDWKGQNADAAVMLVLAGEQFAKYLARQSFEVSNSARRKTMKLTDVNFVIDTDEQFSFLEGCFDAKTGCKF